MDEAPLVGIHRLELKRAAGDAHAFRQLAHALYDPIFTHGTIMFAIDDDFFRVLVSGLQQSVKQKLYRLERFSVASDQSPTFLGVNLQRRVAALVRGFFDLHHETEITEHRVEQIFRGHHRFRFPAGATFSSVGMGCRLF